MDSNSNSNSNINIVGTARTTACPHDPLCNVDAEHRGPLRSAEINIKDVLWDFVRENKPSIIGYLFFSLAGPITNVYLPHLYGKLIADINDKQTIDRAVKLRFLYILVLWILVQCMWAAMNVIDSKFIPKLRGHVRKYIVQKVLDTYREDYSEEELGGIMAEIVRLPDEVDHMFSNIRNHILPMIFMLVFSIGYFTWTNPKLGALSIVSIGLYIGIAFHFSQKCIPTWNDMNDSHEILHGEINDCLGNLLNIYTAHQDQSEVQRLGGYEDHFSEQHRRAIRCVGNFRLALNLSYIFLFCSINLLSFYLFSQGKVQLSDLVSVLIITLELISKMASFIGSIDRIMAETSIIQHVQKSLDLLSNRRVKSVSAQTPAPAGAVNLNGDINIQDLRVEYSGQPVLKGISLQINSGTTNVLVGEIGSGKTSLINALIRLVPYTGDIVINGHNTKTISLADLRSQILYIPQNPKLFNRTIYENISYGQNISKAEIQQAFDRYGISGIDLERSVGKFGQSLSGGQRQIVYLLRCLFRDSPIVVMDEPTSSLDHETKGQILGILQDILRDRTVIIITHDADVLQYADRIITLDRGNLKM